MANQPAKTSPDAAANAAAPLAPILAITWLGSLGTGAVTNGLFFVTHQSLDFTEIQNLSLALVMGASYTLGAWFAAPLVRALAARSAALTTKRVLALVTLGLAGVSLLPYITGGPAWAFWTLAAVYLPLTGLLWPIVEAYLSGGRKEKALRRAMGIFNFAWSSAVFTSFWAMALSLLMCRCMVRDRNASNAGAAAGPGRGFAGSLERLAVAGLLALIGAAWYATAWVSDDAFITLRTIDNALAGHGLVWNVGERVQTYTHPLWMLALLVASAPLGEPYFAALALGGVCTALTLALLVRRTTASLSSALLVLALLLGSRAFIDYSSSGLENPLAHLLLVGLFVACARVASDRRTQLVRGLLACSLLLVRLDLAFLIAPLLLGAWSRDGFPAFRTLLLAGLPLLAWELFSLVYYGAWIANSALAKLSADVPLSARWLQGGHYLLATLRGDPLSAVLLVAGLTAGIRVGGIGRWASAAIVGQLGWVVWVGGDFMAGHFLTAPLVLAAALLGRVDVPADGVSRSGSQRGRRRAGDPLPVAVRRAGLRRDLARGNR